MLVTFRDPAMSRNEFFIHVSDRDPVMTDRDDPIMRTYHRNDTNDKTVVVNEPGQYTLSKNKPK